MLGQRLLVLRDLVALGQVGIKVILAREAGNRTHPAVQRQRRLDGQFDGRTIQHRQRPRQTQADRANVAVRLRAEAGGAAAEDLGRGGQLDVYFQADHRLVPTANPGDPRPFRPHHKRDPRTPTTCFPNDYYTNRVEVHFITYANPIRLDPGIPRIHYHEVEVSTYPLFQYPPYCLALASRMLEVAEQHNLDLLHVHYAIPHSISAMLAKDMLAPVRRLPFITTLHGTDITLVGADRSYFPITKFSIEKSDGITSISEYLRRQTVDVFGVRNDIRVITNFVNCDLYAPDREKAMAKCYAPADVKLLIHVSNFRPVKRVQDCVRILAEVVRRAPAHLLMVGDGPERGPAEYLARELGVERHVSFLGKQNHVERIIPLAHALLMPSELESFGLAALEGMACGVPAVATRVGGVPELITDGVDGYLEASGGHRRAGRARDRAGDGRRTARPRLAGGAPDRHGAFLRG
jgi:N-acetyl-alpha-D-glucosaminyl L-malate synthase BshA